MLMPLRYPAKALVDTERASDRLNPGVTLIKYNEKHMPVEHFAQPVDRLQHPYISCQYTRTCARDAAGRPSDT